MAAKIRGIWLLVCLLPVALYAQQTVRVTGQVFVRAYADGKDTLETLPYASFALLEGKSSTLVKGRTSDAQGRFSFTFTVRADTPYYILKVSYIGTKPEYRRIDPRKAENRLGNIVLADGVELAEVVVTAPMKEVELAGDTTVINASAYKTPEGSNLEELVKRIPGLEYDSQNKSLTYNGLPIAEINVNGEAFFAGNHALALENLPADVVSRIKVYDKRSKMEQFTGVRSGSENYVLDLQTRKEFNGTLMASAAAGAGNNRKKEAELTGNYFKAGGENLSLIAKSGNRNMTTSYKDNRADNIALNFVKKFGPSLSVNGNIMYNNSINGSEGTSYYEQYLNAGNTYRYSSNTSRMENRMASAALGVQWYADDKTLLSFSGNFNTSKSSGENGNRQNTYSADPGLDVSDPFGEGAEEGVAEGIRINAIDMSSVSNSRNSQYMLMAEATRKLNDKGSNISLTVRYSDGRNDNDNFSVSSTTYYQLESYMGGDSVLYRNQYQHSPMRNRSLAAGVSFTQPLGKRLKMQLSYKFQSDRQYSNRDTYDLSPFFGEDNGDRPAGIPSRQLRDRLYGQPEQPKRKPQYLPYDGAYIELCRQGVGHPCRGVRFPRTAKPRPEDRDATGGHRPAILQLQPKPDGGMAQEADAGATDLPGRDTAACVGRPAHTDRQQRPAGHYPWKSRPEAFLQPEHKAGSAGHENRSERRFELDKHTEQRDTGGDLQHHDGRQGKLSGKH